jgi:hypothetical protein
MFALSQKSYSFWRANLAKKAREKLSGTERAGEDVEVGVPSGDEVGGTLGRT